MQCPVDSTELSVKRYAGNLEIDLCGECGGIWLDRGELEAIQDMGSQAYSAELAEMNHYFDDSYEMAKAILEKDYDCPDCKTTMIKREYAYCSQVMIDTCPACKGLWLHQGELAELERFFEECKTDTDSIKTGFFHSLKEMFSK